MICDVHAHYIPQDFGDFMGDRWGPRVGPAVKVKEGIAKHPVSDSATDISGRFELMDEAGVEKQVLSPNHPPYLPDEAECVTAVKMLNDGYAEFAHRYPDRISSYVMLPLPHIDAALKEMERGFDQLGCVGVNMNIVCLDRSIAETEFEPIYAEMNRRGAILFVHPAGNGICSPFIIDYNLPRVGRHLARGRDLCAAHDRQADPAPLPEHQIHRAASRRADPDAAEPPRQAGPEPARPSQPRRGAERHRQEILLRHRVLRLEGGVPAAPSKPSAPITS